MKSSVLDHDAFSNDKTWKEIQICRAKFVLLIITNMFKARANLKLSFLFFLEFIALGI